MKNKIPIILIYNRLLIGLIIIPLSFLQIDHYQFFAITLLIIGLLTDIFDGIVARHLGISTENLRRSDSTVDQIFFVCFVIACYIQFPIFFEINATKIAIILGMEALTYVVSFIKFKKEIATHSIGAKIWTLFLFAMLIEVIFHCESVTLFYFCFWVGILTRIEIIAIILILKNWTHDIPTFFHALKLRQGKEIKRNKLFNG